MNKPSLRAMGCLLVIALLAACTQRESLIKVTPGATQVSAATPPILSETAPVLATAFQTSIQPTSTFTPTAPDNTPTAAFSLCSPLEGITIPELAQPDLLKNPFQPPRAGMDDGHHGVDFSYWSRGERTTMLGLSIFSALPGRVAAVIHNRQPYGNAVIIETPLIDLPGQWLQNINLPAPVPTVQPVGPLQCPADPTNYATAAGRSLYLLYAHMQDTPTLTLGSPVTCGETIGEVGTTGKSVNPHLHLETRVGPSGARFASMSHYDTSATEPERAAYCTWRVSGLFEMFDPMRLLK